MIDLLLSHGVAFCAGMFAGMVYLGWEGRAREDDRYE